MRPPEPVAVTTLLFASLAKEAPAAAKDSVPLPSVTRAWLAEPSEVGKLNVVPPDFKIILEPSDAILSFESWSCSVGVPPLSSKSRPVSATWVKVI